MPMSRDKFNAIIYKISMGSAPTELILSQTSIDAEQCKRLGEELSSRVMGPPVYLDLSKNEIDEIEMRELTTFLKSNDYLLGLNLASNRLGDNGANVVAYFLEANASLQSIALSYNDIGRDGATFIFLALATNQNLQSLNLSNNKIGDNCFHALWSMLKTNRTLRILSLDYNQMSYIVVHGIAEALKISLLQSLNLNGNKAGTAGAKAFAKALETNPPLQLLDLRNNNIGKEGATALAKSLKKNKNLLFLLIQDEHVQEGTLKKIETLLSENRRLAKECLEKSLGDLFSQLQSLAQLRDFHKFKEKDYIKKYTDYKEQIMQQLKNFKDLPFKEMGIDIESKEKQLSQLIEQCSQKSSLLFIVPAAAQSGKVPEPPRAYIEIAKPGEEVQYSPLYLAASEGRVEDIQALIKSGAEVNQAEKDGWTPLCIAAQNGHEKAVEALLTGGAEINQPINKGWTALLLATYAGKEAVVRVLLQRNSGLNAVTDDGRTALIIAEEEGHQQIVRLLNTHAPPKRVRSRTQPVASEEAITKAVNNGSLLQILQAEQAEQAKQKKVPAKKSSNASANAIEVSKPIIDVIIQTLKSLEKEELNTVSTNEIQAEAQQLQKQLQKDLNSQKQQQAVCEEQQKELLQRISDLKTELSQKADKIDQQRISADLEAVKQQLDGVKDQLSVLWNEYEVKAQKRAALQKFQSHPNLILFYRMVQIKLEETFIGFKTVASGFVDPAAGKTATAATIVGCLGDVAGMVPIVGAAIDKVCQWTSKALVKVDGQRQSNTAINASSLVTLSEAQRYAESVARQLTECYAEQLVLLASPEEAEVFDNKLQKGIKKAKEVVLKVRPLPPAKQLATFAVIWMTDKLYDMELKEEQELDSILVSQVTERQPPQKIQEFWNTVTTAVGLQAGLCNKKGEVWQAEQVYTLPGIKIKTAEGDAFQYYSSKVVQPEKFGWRIGTQEAVKTLQLKLVPAPSHPTNPLQDKRVMQSVTLVRKDVRRVEDVSRKHEEQLELLQKTGGIISSHQMRNVEDQLERERREKQDLAKRLEQLEKDKEREKKEKDEATKRLEQRLEQMERMLAQSPKNSGAATPAEPAIVLQFSKSPSTTAKSKLSPKSGAGEVGQDATAASASAVIAKPRQLKKSNDASKQSDIEAHAVSVGVSKPKVTSTLVKQVKKKVELKEDAPQLKPKLHSKKDSEDSDSDDFEVVVASTKTKGKLKKS